MPSPALLNILLNLLYYIFYSLVQIFILSEELPHEKLS
jgi:hypothetical protein